MIDENAFIILFYSASKRKFSILFNHIQLFREILLIRLDKMTNIRFVLGSESIEISINVINGRFGIYIPIIFLIM